MQLGGLISMAKSLPVLCGSIAGSIGGMGVLMHNAAYKALGLNYTYVSFQPDNLEYAITGMKTLGFRGLGVTMPFKQEVIQYLDILDESARMIGAVNTIVNDDGVLKGYNTDWTGAIRALEEACDIRDKKVAVLGAGGAGRAILYALKKYTKDIVLYNNNESKGRDVADHFKVKYFGSIDKFNSNTEYDILINTTSVGFKSEASILTSEQMKQNKIVFDVVFSPIETTLLKIAKSLGCITIPGYRMLIHQACYQFELYTGVKAPFEVMEKAMFDKINESPSNTR